MKLTRRALGEAAAAVAAAVLTPSSGAAQTVAPAAPPQGAQRNWLAEARDSHNAAARAIARVEVPMDVEPAFRFHA